MTVRTFQTKRDMVYASLKESILSGQLQPGDRLNIGSLAKEFSISEIPVREAIQVLESEKLVNIVPHSGAVVAPISAQDLDEILQLRIYLESLATYLATPHLTDEDLEKLEKNLKKQAFFVEMNELDDFGKLNLEFHELIYEKCSNKRLKGLIASLLDHSKRYRTVFQNNLDFTAGSVEEHKRILEVLKEKDAEKARELMSVHKERSSAEIKRKWIKQVE